MNQMAIGFMWSTIGFEKPFLKHHKQTCELGRISGKEEKKLKYDQHQ